MMKTVTKTVGDEPKVRPTTSYSCCAIRCALRHHCFSTEIELRMLCSKVGTFLR